jgi:hypothetical protein
MTTIDKTNDSEIRNRCLAVIGDDGGEGELIFFEDLDAAIIGVGTTAGNPPRVVYDRQRCIEILAEQLGPLAEEGAEEYFVHNVEQGYVGTATPLFLMWIRNETA